MNTVKAIYPGSFDPVTNGHLDLIARAANIFDHLVVAILRNSEKNPLFTVEERVAMLSEGIAEFDNVSVSTFDGLLVDFAREERAHAVVRGIRAISDYEYEFQMALMNRRLAPDVRNHLPHARRQVLLRQLTACETSVSPGRIRGWPGSEICYRADEGQRPQLGSLH